MSNKKILLKGYYGFGNLGDDLLFICNYNLLSRLFPESEIDVFTESHYADYLSILSSRQQAIIRSGNTGSYDIIWHGGGGVFFDFNEGGKLSLIMNKAILLVGSKIYTRAYTVSKRILGKPEIRYKKRIGFGIGVGGFTPSSKKFRHSICQLSSFDCLVVRDQESRKSALQVCPSLNVLVATDIVFDKSLWKEFLIKKNTANKTAKRIAIILRDWIMSDGYNYFEDVYSVAVKLKAKGLQVEFFAFDAHTDQAYISFFTEKGIDVHTWKPEAMKLASYIALLAEQDLIITSRFHGAVVGACLGIPGICLNIEPKLEAVPEMLGESYHLEALPVGNLFNAALNMLAQEGSAEKLDKALADNRAKLERAYKAIENIL
ncbi:MAG TPA: polysaccharide pyruvyl transferase family protein [Niabella sp.]|nr:polysaccharide pyruvyl transferase family protein [Niabella sp.]